MNESGIDGGDVDDARQSADAEFDERLDQIQEQVDSITEKVNEAMEKDKAEDDTPLA